MRINIQCEAKTVCPNAHNSQLIFQEITLLPSWWAKVRFILNLRTCSLFWASWWGRGKPLTCSYSQQSHVVFSLGLTTPKQGDRNSQSKGLWGYEHFWLLFLNPIDLCSCLMTQSETGRSCMCFDERLQLKGKNIKGKLMSFLLYALSMWKCSVNYKTLCC